MRCLNCGNDDIPPDKEVCPGCTVHLPTLLRDVLPPGTLLHSGVYRLDYALGWGGFGIIYLATHISLEQMVAIKEFFPREHVLRNGRTGQVSIKTTRRRDYDQALQRFIREGRTLARLGRFNIEGVVRVYDLFEENGTGYLVMELISPSRTLREELDAHPSQQLSPERVQTIARQLVKALEAVHGEGVYHLDISPDNVLLRPDDSVVLIDFGAARQGLGTKTTQAFKLEYAAPEVIAGGEVGPESDIFELGMMTHEMLTGSRPPSALSRLTGHGWEPTGFDEPWQKLLGEALKLQRVERPGSVKQWWGDWLTKQNGGNGGAQGVMLPHCVGCREVTDPNQILCPSCIKRTVDTAVASARAEAPREAKDEGPNDKLAGTTADGTKPKKATGGKASKAFFSVASLLLLVSLVGLGAAYNSARSNLADEKLKRERLAGRYPIQITDIKFRNESKDKPIGTYATSFNDDSIRFITWHATVKSNWDGDRTVSGDLYVKYIKPDGTVSRSSDPNISPPDHTQKLPFSVSDSTEVWRGWGNANTNSYSIGTYRVQFWYEDKLLAEKSFSVY